MSISFFVDDEEAIVKSTKQLLGRLGYKVTAEASGLNALKAFRRNPDTFDLVIKDQTMPDLSGVELINKLVKTRPEIPIILCTGYSELIVAQRAKETGVRSFASNPLSVGEIAETIREVLDNK